MPVAGVQQSRTPSPTTSHGRHRNLLGFRDGPPHPFILRARGLLICGYMTLPHRIVTAAEVVGDHRHGAEVKALLGPKSVQATSGFMGVGTIRPGEVIREHYHPYSEEFTYLVQGRLVATVDGQPCEIVAGQGMMVPINMRHRLANEGDEDAFIVFSMAPLAPRPDLGHVSTETEAGT